MAALTPGLAKAANAHTFLIFSQASGFYLESSFHTALVLTLCLLYPRSLLGTVKRSKPLSLKQPHSPGPLRGLKHFIIHILFTACLVIFIATAQTGRRAKAWARS